MREKNKRNAWMNGGRRRNERDGEAMEEEKNSYDNENGKWEKNDGGKKGNKSEIEIGKREKQKTNSRHV